MNKCKDRYVKFTTQKAAEIYASKYGHKVWKCPDCRYLSYWT